MGNKISKKNQSSVAVQQGLIQLSTNIGILVVYLRPAEVLAFGLSNKQIFTSLLPYINSNFYFQVFPDVIFAHYHPQRLIIYTPNKWKAFTNVTHIKFSNYFNSNIADLPATLTHLRFGSTFNQPIDDFLPQSLTHIEFGDDFNHPFSKFPPSLKSISFPHESKFEQPLEIPASVRFLALRNPLHHYPSTLEDIQLNIQLVKGSDAHLPPLPQSLTKIMLGYFFNDPLPDLPPNLKEIFFGRYFNQPIDSLPSSVQVIHFPFGSTFNLPVTAFPPSLTDLNLGQWFNHPLDNLPPSLKTITFSSRYSKPTHHLPQSLESITFGMMSEFSERITLPPSLRSLVIGTRHFKDISAIPNSVKMLAIIGSAVYDLTSLPPQLETLDVHGDCLAELPAFPPSLRQLTIHQSFKGPFNSLPRKCSVYCRAMFVNLFSTEKAYKIPNVVSIQYPALYNDGLTLLPPFVQILILISKFNKPLINLPKGLKMLQLSEEFNQPVDKLPPGLLVLHLGHSFNQPLNSLPRTLRQLMVRNTKYCHDLSKLPVSLVELQMEVEPGIFHSIPAELQPVVGKISSRWTYCCPGDVEPDYVVP